MQTIIGIDPGTAITGFGIVDKVRHTYAYRSHGVIRTIANTPLTDRLLEIEADLQAIIDKHKPDVAVVEKIFFQTNAKTAISVAQSRGVVLLTLTKAGIPIVEVTPTSLKSSITGNGRADKYQMQHMVKAILQLQEIPRPDDAADALALALFPVPSSATMSGI